MATLDAMQVMLQKSGLSAYAAAKALGKSHTYVSNLFTRGSVPNGDRLASIARACGYRLVLVPGDHVDDVERVGGIVIDGDAAD